MSQNLLFFDSPIKRQILSSYLLKGASVFISLMYVPLMLTYLSPSQFGLWIAISSVINWLRLFDIGIGNGLKFKLASTLATGNIKKSRELISTTYAVIIGIFGIIWLFCLLIIPTINWQSLLNDDLKIIVDYNYIMRIAVTAIIGLFIMDIVKIIYAAHGNTAVGNKLQLAGSALSLIGIWFLSVFTIKGQLDLAIMVIAYSPLLVNIFANLYAYSTKFRILRPKISLVKLKNSKDLFNLSIKFFVVQITATIVYASLPFVISRFYGPESVAQYHVANSIFNFPILLISLFTAPITPFVTIEFSKGNSAWIRESLKKTLILAGIVCLGTGLMIIISPWIYQFWLGDKIAVSFNLSIVLGIFSIINILVNPLSTFLNAIGKIDLFVFLAPIEISLFIGGCFLFDYLLNDVTAIILALSITNSLGLILEPLILKKYDLFPKFTY